MQHGVLEIFCVHDVRADLKIMPKEVIPCRISAGDRS
jgi:hypothetical protein